MTSFFQNIRSVSRMEDWRLSLVPFIIGCVYFWLFFFDIPFHIDGIILFLLSLTTTFGFAALGYFINEFFDKDADRQAGKINKLAYIKPVHQALLLLAALLVTFLPWLWLPANKYSWLLIITEIGLFLVYSLPFPRLKSVPLVSNLVDAGYAYVVPLVLAFYTYSLFQGVSLDPVIFIFALGVFFIGFRNIFIHQINDVFKDKRAGLQTLPRYMGVRASRDLLHILLINEWVIINVFSIMIALRHPEVWLWFLFYNGFTIYRLTQHHKVFNSIYFVIKRSRHLTDEAYQIWFPLFAILMLAFVDLRWLILLPVQLSILTPHWIFYPFVTVGVWLSYYFSRLLDLRFRVYFLLSLMVNYPIYYAFKMFGVDLKKENTTALKYIKKKFE